jgi:hypothetical protein
MMHQLQERLSHEQGTMEKCAGEMTEEQRLYLLRCQLDREIKTLTEQRDAVSEDIRQKIEDGLVVGQEGAGYFTLQPSKPRESFDYDKALKEGYFTADQIKEHKARFWKVTTPKPSLVHKKYEEEK